MSKRTKWNLVLLLVTIDLVGTILGGCTDVVYVPLQDSSADVDSAVFSDVGDTNATDSGTDAQADDAWAPDAAKTHEDAALPEDVGLDAGSDGGYDAGSDSATLGTDAGWSTRHRCGHNAADVLGWFYTNSAGMEVFLCAARCTVEDRVECRSTPVAGWYTAKGCLGGMFLHNTPECS